MEYERGRQGNGTEKRKSLAEYLHPTNRILNPKRRDGPMKRGNSMREIDREMEQRKENALKRIFSQPRGF